MNEPDFSRKIRLRHIVPIIVLKLHAKFQKDPMTGYRVKVRTDERTDERTNERTDEHGSIYRTNLQSRWVQKRGGFRPEYSPLGPKLKKCFIILKKCLKLLHQPAWIQADFPQTR